MTTNTAEIIRIGEQAAGLAYSDRVMDYVRVGKSANTRRAYRAGLADFTAWCERAGAVALPAESSTVAEYLAALADAGARVATIGQRLAAISFAHRTAGLPNPATCEDVREVMAGIRRKLGTAPSRKAPVTLADLRRMVDALPDNLAGVRDRTLLLVGFAGAFRRSEIVAVDVADLCFQGDTLAVGVRRSKTDQAGEGTKKFLPALADQGLCPVRALRAWLDVAGIASGPVFCQIDRWGNPRKGSRLTGQSVSLVVKAAAERAGLPAAQFAGHSLRSGFITAAANAATRSRDIMAQSGHRSEAVMRGYIRDAGLGARRAVLAAFGEQA